MLTNEPVPGIPHASRAEHDIIVVRYEETQSDRHTVDFRSSLETIIKKQRSLGQPVNILLDISKLRYAKSTTVSRNEFKKMAQLDFDAAAVVANNSISQMVGYFIKTANRRHRLRFFSNEHRAMKWLQSGRQVAKVDKPIAALVAAITISAIGLLSLLGWTINDPRLTQVVLSLRPINPLSALSCVVLGIGFLGIYLKHKKTIQIASAWLIFTGLLALSPLHVDKLLFAHSVREAGSYALIAKAAAFCFIVIGLCLSLYKRKLKSVNALTVLVILLALFSVYGSLYDRQGLYNLNSSLVMSFNASIVFLIASIVLLSLEVRKDRRDFIGQTTKSGWLVVAVFLSVQIVTYVLWNQSENRNMTFSKQTFNSATAVIDNNITARIQSYNNVLNGLKGFFGSSSFVSQGEFDSYNKSLGLATNYPGLRSIAYIQQVTTKQIPAYIAARQVDDSLYPQGNKNFAIRSQSSLPVHDIVTYISNSSSVASFGLDLSSTASRRTAFEKAAATNQSIASGTVLFNLTPGQPVARGFFITIPVRYEGPTQPINGFVNVAFNYKSFFQYSFDRSDLLNHLNVTITDKQDNSTVLSSNLVAANQKLPFLKHANLPIENDSWSMTIKGPANYALSAAQRNQPAYSLVAGQLFALLLLVIFIMLNNSRGRVLRLADAITEDLQRERRSALTLALKDEAMLSAIGEGLIAFNQEGEVERVNSAALKMLGFSEAEMVGQHYSRVLRGADANGKEVPIEKRQLTKALKTGKPMHDEEPFSYFRKDGTSFPARFNIAPVILQDKTIGVIDIFRDITKDLELDKQKDEFVSLTSHQLRTPLTAIRLFVEMLQDEQVGKLNPAQHDYLGKVADSTRRMIELVGDFLNNSRVDLGRLKVEPQPTQLETLVTDYVNEAKPMADKKKINLQYRPRPLPVVNIDQNLYGQIVHNLLTNAIRYTPDGGKVTVELAKVHSGYQLTVSDTGIGIPKAAQSKLFQRFYRADNAMLMEGEGSGLGLYLVRRILELVGGSISYETAEQKGTTFRVIIPANGMQSVNGEVSLSNNFKEPKK